MSPEGRNQFHQFVPYAKVPTDTYLAGLFKQVYVLVLQDTSRNQTIKMLKSSHRLLMPRS